jgi:hypothetical protein
VVRIEIPDRDAAGDRERRLATVGTQRDAKFAVAVGQRRAAEWEPDTSCCLLARSYRRT